MLRHCNFAAFIRVCALTTMAAACDSAEPDTGKERNASDSKADAGDDPLYVIATSYITGEDIETYLVTSKTFDQSTEIEPKDGPKLLGGIDIVVHKGSVFAPASNGPVLLRYGIDSNDKLEQQAELSFAGVGLSELLGGHVYVVSDTKGYVFDPKEPRLIVWNPKTMELTGEQIDLSDIARDGFSPRLSLGLVNLGAVRRGSELLIPLGWQDQDGNSRHASGLVVIDSDNDQLIAVDEDERCGEAYTSVAAPGGDIYFFPPAWSSTQHYFVDNHRPTCLLRVRPDQQKFDDDYKLDLSALGSGSAAAGAIPDGKNGFFFLSADEALWDKRDGDLDAFWRVWHYDFKTEQSREIEALPTWTGHAHYVNLDGQVAFVYWEETDRGNRTTFYGVDGAKDPERLFSFEASWYSFAKLR